MNKLTWTRGMIFGLLLPLALSAQDYSVPESEAPPAVSAALRERVNEFFQYHVGGINRRAIDLVAEDTKDYYFQSGKVQFLGFKITDFNFTKDLQRASVHLETTQNWAVQQYSTVATTPVVTNWKLEDGKWVWFLDVQAQMKSVTPMGDSAPPSAPKATLTAEPMTNPDGTFNLPKDFADPARVAVQGTAILKQAGLDKDSVTLAVGAKGEDQVTFHNGFNGSVSLKLYDVPQIPGLSIALSKSDLNGAEDAVVQFVYAPQEGAAPQVGRQYTLRLGLIPFNQEFPIKFAFRTAQ